jgi:predicted Kef-type K+ transport protein
MFYTARWRLISSEFHASLSFLADLGVLILLFFIGLYARLTTEIIVAQLLFNAGLIDVRLFTALVAAASFTAITVSDYRFRKFKRK